MYVLINNGDGTHYASVAFACYRETVYDAQGKKIPDHYRWYYLVLNQEKTALVKKYKYDGPQMVFELDDSTEGWNLNDDDTGEINTHNKTELLAMERNGVGFVTLDLIEEDRKHTFNEVQNILSQYDVDRLITLSNGFLDSYIEEIEQGDDSLRLLLHIEGGSVEIWFSEDIQYNMGFRANPRHCPDWEIGGCMWLENGYVYLADDIDMTAAKLTDKHGWFRARKAKYTLHLIS